MFQAIMLTFAVLGAIVALIKHDHEWNREFHEYFFTTYVGGSIGAMIGLLIACLIVGIPQ
jgi:uncharacterized membrane protein